MADYDLTHAKTEYDAPENSITLNLSMGDGTDVRLTVTGYKDERHLFAALHNVGKQEFLYSLAQSMIAEMEEDDDDE